nr:PREDICTED: uncharacterized protein LOC104217690 [Nicotiana sylvestris]XP_016436511.1 PREDICTED: uncharacterized protein LOC107762561 isoform X2 [Nicotiana tabacum]
MRETLLSEADTSKPDEGKKRQRESSNEPLESKKTKVEEPTADPTALTPEVAGSPRAEGEGKNDSIASEGGENSINPYTAEMVAPKSELGAVVVQPWAEEATEEVLDNVLEPADGQNIPRDETHLVGGSEETSSEALQGQETTLIDPISITNVSDSPMGMTLPHKETQDAQNEELSNVGAPLGGRDAFQRPLAAPEKILELDASLIFSEINRHYEHVVFVNSAYRSDLCLSNLSLSWLQARALYNQTFAQFQVKMTRHKR